MVVIIDRLQNRVGGGGAYLRWLQLPLHHLVLVLDVARGPPCRQFAVTVEQVAEELETLQVACLGHQSTVSVAKLLLGNIRSFSTKEVIVAHALVVINIGDDLSVVDRSLTVAIGGDVAIEHAVHHHGTYVSGC